MTSPKQTPFWLASARKSLLVCMLLMVANLCSTYRAQAASFIVACDDIAGLIAAINTANGNGQADTITLATNCTYTLTAIDNGVDGANGLPNITSELTIVGRGAIIERSGAAPDFRIMHVASNGILTLQGLTIRGGQTSGSWPSSAGGGIFNNRGVLTIRNSHITLNTATNSGAGLYNYSGTLILSHSTVSQNAATGDAGGLHNDGAAAAAMVTIDNSTFSANTASGGGGAILTTLNGSTATLNIYNTTFVGNSAPGGGGINTFGAPPNNVVNVYNSILSNVGAECAGNVFAASGSNLIDDATCGPAANPVSGLSATLVNNGGDTLTHALLAGSNAIDSGDAGTCAAAPVNGIDQRNVARPQGTGCDIGAYETFLIDFNGLYPQSGAGAKDELNTSYSARGLNFDFFDFSGNYPEIGADNVVVATNPAGADALVNFDFAADFVRLKYVNSGQLGAYLTAYAQTITAATQPAVWIDQSSDLVNPYPKSLTATGACIRSVQIETVGFDFSFDDLEIHPMSGPDTDGDGVVDQCDRQFIVNSVDDSDDGACDGSHCSLREAIHAANAQLNGAAADEIHFTIAGAGVHTIQPTSALPYSSEAVIIDGSTQPGASCAAWPPTLQIVLDGTNASGEATSGLVTFVGNMTVRGLVIHNFANENIGLYAGNNTIQCNYLGTDATGTLAQGNSFDNLFVNGTSSNNQIGGTTPGTGNLFGGGASRGIALAAATNNIVQGNYIGIDPSGTSQVGSLGAGILVSGNNNQIGGATTAERNVIAGASVGIDVAVGTGNTIRGNYIGTNASGNAGIANDVGVWLNGGATNTFIQDNLIAYNDSDGIQIDTGVGNTIRSNAIYANGGLGIDLGNDGVTFNHAGAIVGPNNYQNYPVLTLATSNGSNTRLQGTLDSTANTTLNLDFFASHTCDESSFGEGQSLIGTLSVTTDGSGKANFDTTFPIGVAESQGISAIASNAGNGNSSEFSYCRPISTDNVNWQAAQLLTLSEVGGGLVGETVQQRIVDRFQEKWFKFAVQPGDKLHIKLTGLPGSAVSLHRDPLPFYNSLSNPSSAAVLSAEAADTGFLPSGSLPSGSLPSGSLPSGSLPSGSLPTGYLPSGSLPSGSLPSGSLPSGSLPSGSLPSGSLPSGSLPSGSLPSGSLPSGSLPSGSLPSGSLPEAYSGAARRSLIGIALDPYATVQTIDRNTYDLLENVYVRVVGPYDPINPFTLEVTVKGGVCSDIQTVPDSIPFTPNPPVGTHKTLILTHSGRLAGEPGDIPLALQKLQELAARSDVDGVVIDLAAAQYQRVAWANDQADQNLACPTAKNLVADEIKRVIDSYRAANQLAGKTTLEYIVLAGGADVIPFFQIPDVAGLANEKEYVVPVKPSTASEAGLKVGLVQSQDGYGAQAEISRGDHSFAVPDLAVGRLVETANDIGNSVDAYIATNGVVTPTSALVTGYDFVGDAARAINIETNAGTGSVSDLLIQDPGLPPSDPSAWSAGELRTELFTGGHDLVVLSGHFSAGSLLAADYRTTMTAAEISASSVDFTNVLVLTLGCHGGYTIPTIDQLPGASPDPDWAKAFLRKQAAGYIAATGYAYGDTELTEYGERLFVGLAQQLRTGSGAVALGAALVAAKQQYLAETAQLSGIDEKTIIEMTLYGLPMMKVNMPGQRLNPEPENSIVAVAIPVTGGPGAALGLRIAQPTVTSLLTTNTVQLQNIASGGTIVTTYLSGKDGVVANPFEPIFPKEIYNVAVNGALLRSVTLRGGSYTDQTGVTPLTTAPATETSRPHTSFNSDVFYPTQLWLPNFFDAIHGGVPRLITVPSQFQSTTAGATDGILRQFSNLQLNLYYLDANWTSGSPTVRSAAVAASPTILGASGVVTGTNVKFSVNVQSDATAGIQSVWVLYTGNSGSPFHGQWLPLDLAQPDPALGPTLWEGILPLGGNNPSGLVFMVQAVNGAGLATLATNLGAYYPVAPSTPPPPPKPTTLILQPQPTTGRYLQPSSFQLLLIDQTNGQPVANQTVIMSLGGQGAQSTTDTSGQATIALQPGLTPGDYPVQATFRGNATYLGSSATRNFTLEKDSTTLALSAQSPSLLAVLSDSANRALSEKSVFFVVSGNGQTFVQSVIADLYGNAPLGVVPLPPGSYRVDAYFSGEIALGNGQIVTLNDDHYLPAQATGTLTIAQTDFTPPIVMVNFPVPPPAQNGWFNAQDAASGILGSVTTNDTASGGSNITAINCTGAAIGTIGGLGTSQAGALLTVSAEGSNVINCTASDSANNNGAAAGSSNTATVKIDKSAPDTLISGKPTHPTISPSAIFTFTGNDGSGSGVAGFACKLDGGSFAACSSPQSYTNLAVGSHTFTVRASDVAGNVDPTPALYSWTVQVNPNTLIGSCAGFDVYRTPQGQYLATGWSGTIVVGTSSNNTLNGTSGRDLMLGLAGNDSMDGKGGDDLLCGGDGVDLVQGFAGNDLLEGGVGNDVLNGGIGDYDQLRGGDGNDTLLDGDGVSIASGGAGSDLLTLALRNGWRDATGQARFTGLAAGYGNDVVALAILNSAQFLVDITGDERDQPASPLEGKNDSLALVGVIKSGSIIIKFEQRLVVSADATVDIPTEEVGEEYLTEAVGEEAAESNLDNHIYLPTVSR